MGKFFKRVWRYIAAALTGKFEELADPKIQVEQAIEEAEKQHRMLTQQAASVIAHQKDTEIQLNRAIDQVEKLSTSSRQALLMADGANKRGDDPDAEKYEQAAQAFAQRLIVAEQEVESLKAIHLQASEAAEQAKRAVQNNRMQLEKKYTEKSKLLSQLDQAKMQERMATAMQSMSSTTSEEVPTMDEVRRKIEQRYARAVGAAELQQDTVEGKMLEVEQASMDFEADARLDDIRKQLGLETHQPQQAVSGGASGELGAESEGAGAGQADSEAASAKESPKADPN